MNGNALLLKADRTSMKYASFFILIYGIIRILICFFVEEDLGSSIRQYISSSLYSIAGICGMLSFSRYSIKLIDIFRYCLIVLFVLNLIALLLSIGLIISFGISAPECYLDDGCEYDKEYYLPIGIYLIVAIVMSVLHMVYLKAALKIAKFFKDDLAYYLRIHPVQAHMV